MASTVSCKAPLSLAGMQVLIPLRKAQSLRPASNSRARGNLVRAGQFQSVPPSRVIEDLSLKDDAEAAALKVFCDDTKGIVCYRTESGEVICEGMDEGPHFYPPCGANFYIPDTRAAAILPLLGEVMYEI